MIRAIEAIAEDSGLVRLAEPLHINGPRRALVTILDEPSAETLEAAVISESGLSDWSRPEEAEAWSHLQ
jgi:hypothetical protein